MPEGPETRRMADKINKSLKGKKILGFKFYHKSLTQFTNLKKVLIKDVLSRGKAVVIRLDNGFSIISHNQLYGKWTFHRPETVIKSNRQLRIEFTTKSKVVRLWSATDIQIFRSSVESDHSYLKKIGPDVLDTTTTSNIIISILKG